MPVRLLHVTDLHLTLSDECDDKYRRDHAAHRSGVFSLNEKNPAPESFAELLNAADDADLILFTGDIADFPSSANLDHIKNMLGDKKFIYCQGNHDWNYPCDYPFGTANWDFDQSILYDAALAKTREAFLPLTSGDIDVTMVNGLKVIAVNNSSYRFSSHQYSRLEQELASGTPTVVAFHIPLYAPTLMEDTLKYWHLPIICGGGDEVHTPYWSYRTDEATAKVCRLLGESKSVVCVISGHLHFDHVDILPGGNTQYVTALANRCNATLFNILPK